MSFKNDILFMRTNYICIELDNVAVIHGGYTSDIKRT